MASTHLASATHRLVHGDLLRLHSHVIERSQELLLVKIDGYFVRWEESMIVQSVGMVRSAQHGQCVMAGVNQHLLRRYLSHSCILSAVIG